MVFKLNIKTVFESLGSSLEEQEAILKMKENLMEKTAHLNKPGDIKVPEDDAFWAAVYITSTASKLLISKVAKDNFVDPTKLTWLMALGKKDITGQLPGGKMVVPDENTPSNCQIDMEKVKKACQKRFSFHAEGNRPEDFEYEARVKKSKKDSAANLRASMRGANEAMEQRTARDIRGENSARNNI